MTGLLFAAVMVVGVPAEDFPAPRTIVQWRRDVSQALQLHAKAKTPAEVSDAVRTLTRLDYQVKIDRLLPQFERQQLHAKMWSRLLRVKNDLKRDAKRRSSLASTPKNNTPTINEFGGHGGGAVGPGDSGQELVDLIQTTIAPDFWDTVGGPGVIYYWPNFHALVVSATGDVHENLGGLVDGLRRAGP